jgi:DNA repair photolyase
LISKGLYPESLIYDPLISKENEYGVSVVSLSDDFRKKYEPNASPIDYRIKALKRLHDAGLKTWVSMEPYPTPNIIDQDINGLLSEISFVDRIIFGKWNYNSKSARYSDHKNFYSTKIKEVIKFGYHYGIEVYIKNDTLNLSDSN